MNLRGVTFDRVNLSAAKLAGHDFSRQKLRSVNFMGADLSSVSFTNADISTYVFQGACLSSALLEGVTARQCLFSGANLENVQARKGDFAQSFFRDASLSHADFRSASLRDAKFTRANLFLSCMHGTIQEKTVFIGANTLYPRGPDPDMAEAETFNQLILKDNIYQEQSIVAYNCIPGDRNLPPYSRIWKPGLRWLLSTGI